MNVHEIWSSRMKAVTEMQSEQLEITEMAHSMVLMRFGSRFITELIQQSIDEQLSRPQLRLLIIQAITDNTRDQFVWCERAVKSLRGQYPNQSIKEILYQLCEV